MERIIEFFKRHKIISVLLIVFIVYQLYSFGVYLYNSYQYGRFVKIGEMDIENIPFIQVPHGLLDDNRGAYIFNPFHNEYNIYYIDFYSQTLKKNSRTLNSGFLIPLLKEKNKIIFFSASNPVEKAEKYTSLHNTSRAFRIMTYDTYNDLVYLYPVIHKYFVYNTKIFLTDSHKVIMPNFYDKKGSGDSQFTAAKFSIESKKFTRVPFSDKKTSVLIPYRLKCLYGENVFYSSHEKDANFIIYDPSLDNFIKIDNTDLKKAKFVAENGMQMYISLNQNTILLMSHPMFSGKYTYFNLFEVDDKKLTYIKTISFYNNGFWNLNKISGDNIVVLNPNQVLFVGGLNGTADFVWATKSVYLLDIKKDKVTRLSDFPFKIYGQYLFSNKGKVVIVNGFKNGLHGRTKMKSVYMFVPGKNIAEKEDKL